MFSNHWLIFMVVSYPISLSYTTKEVTEGQKTTLECNTTSKFKKCSFRHDEKVCTFEYNRTRFDIDMELVPNSKFCPKLKAEFAGRFSNGKTQLILCVNQSHRNVKII